MSSLGSLLGNRSALVLTPGALNYFYDVAGRRVAEALRSLGIATRLVRVGEPTERELAEGAGWDFAFVINLAEVLAADPDPNQAARKMALVRERAGRLITWAMDAVHTEWYRQIERLADHFGVDLIADAGLVDQSPLLAKSRRAMYRFVLAALTQRERDMVQSTRFTDTKRVFPWAVVGHETPDRVRLLERLTREIDPRGFVYLPPLAPYRTGREHLDEAGLERVLSRTRLYIWRAHHDRFYMESERFRQALLAGALPLKIVRSDEQTAPVPFQRWLVEETDLARLRTLEFATEREAFRAEYLTLPTLEQGLATLLEGVELTHGLEQGHGQGRRHDRDSKLESRDFFAAVDSVKPVGVGRPARTRPRGRGPDPG